MEHFLLALIPNPCDISQGTRHIYKMTGWSSTQGILAAAAKNTRREKGRKS